MRRWPVPDPGAQADRYRAAVGRPAEDRGLPRPVRGQPGQRRADPGLGGRLRPVRLRDRCDHGRARARPARPGLRPDIRAARPGGGGYRGGRPGGERHRHLRRRHAGQLRPDRWPGQVRGDRQDDRDPGRAGRGPGGGQLPAARLAGLPAAVLGDAHPDRLLPGLRRGPRARRAAAGGPAGSAWPGPGAQGRLAAGRRRGLGHHRVPQVRRHRPARHRHDGHLRRLLVVLPAVLLARLHVTARSASRRCGAGRRSTCTWAASSTPSCT